MIKCLFFAHINRQNELLRDKSKKLTFVDKIEPAINLLIERTVATYLLVVTNTQTTNYMNSAMCKTSLNDPDVFHSLQAIQ